MRVRVELVVLGLLQKLVQGFDKLIDELRPLDNQLRTL